jgi:hypothetical protein
MELRYEKYRRIGVWEEAAVETLVSELARGNRQ